MARAPANDRPRDNQEALALWVSQRHGAEGSYRRVLNERENDLMALSEAGGPRSRATKRPLENCIITRLPTITFSKVCDGR